MNIKTMELKDKGNILFGFERGGPCLDGSLRSTVIGNKDGEKKKPLFIKEGAVNNVFAAVPVVIDDVVVFVECDKYYNISIYLTRVVSVSKSNSGKIIATCEIFDTYKREEWKYSEHEKYSDIIRAALLRATTLKKTSVYTQEII
ncbi:hypothetical protein [Romboutsia ilealis]|uniref:hypothetical protein n=1 Tax=Romboutsia ilealis TaxID=1115758 RepID=UPI00272CAA84|nr:hypothetical protein [Romboutsia ilealis]